MNQTYSETNFFYRTLAEARKKHKEEMMITENKQHNLENINDRIFTTTVSLDNNNREKNHCFDTIKNIEEKWNFQKIKTQLLNLKERSTDLDSFKYFQGLQGFQEFQELQGLHELHGFKGFQGNQRFIGTKFKEKDCQ